MANIYGYSQVGNSNVFGYTLPNPIDSVTINSDQVITGKKSLTNVANVLAGDGSAITNVPAPTNMVTTDTTQDISGAKTFVSSVSSPTYNLNYLSLPTLSSSNIGFQGSETITTTIPFTILNGVTFIPGLYIPPGSYIINATLNASINYAGGISPYMTKCVLSLQNYTAAHAWTTVGSAYNPALAWTTAMNSINYINHGINGTFFLQIQSTDIISGTNVKLFLNCTFSGFTTFMIQNPSTDITINYIKIA